MQEKTIKQMLRAIQDKRQCTQTALAEIVGVAKSQITKWLDETSIPRIEWQRKIKKIYDETVEGRK